ncbi:MULTISPECIES: ComEA family DNA-binding protein [unclassified Microbacterium]|uniref:ComEA family DNA-binding protein n=1 Tax=unclassified Microbacterium TaxID=2609290 RepID=UPI0016050096|nr:MULTISPECIES: ComEA family DNA-binding protein [unclassified Microbacterium]QNA92824.1 ComEA family DNA-binding protein [Microbacterium sp. Se63.02b]QYM62969.1 ComEA family DNA-binding protein [Microbacterium sp. Se5.02b]
MTSPQTPPRPPRRRLRLSVGAAVVLALVVLSAAVGFGLLRGQAPPSDSLSLTDVTTTDAPAGELYVHVLGAVARPGLYVLDLNARLVDAVAAAGGTTDEADLAAVNLARTLEDGEQIVVPTVGVATDAPVADAPGDDRVDLNTADQGALETLPRIGPALAERIIAWREDNGRFRSVDDLLAVPGIGEKLLAGLRDAVRV